MKLLVLALALAAAGAQDQPPRALDLLEDSGHQYEKAGDGWAVKFNGNNLKDIRIIVVQAGGVLVLGSVLATRNEIADTSVSSYKQQLKERESAMRALLDKVGGPRPDLA